MQKNRLFAAAVFLGAVALMLVCLDTGRLITEFVLEPLLPFRMDYGSARRRFLSPLIIEKAALSGEKVSVRIKRAVIRFYPQLVPPEILIRCDFNDLEVVPRFLAEVPLLFTDASLEIEKRAGFPPRAVLRGWRSNAVEIQEGEIAFESGGKPASLALRGTLRSFPVQDFLPFLPRETSWNNRPVPFELSLREGLLEVFADGRLLFRSKWLRGRDAPVAARHAAEKSSPSRPGPSLPGGHVLE